MRVEVLGAFGGETPQQATVSLLVDNNLAIDAGSLCRRLGLDAQLHIESIVLSHAHMDHVQSLALFADQIIGRRTTSVPVYCSPKTKKTLKDHMFNDALWPNFTQLPTKSDPVIKLQSQRPGRRFATTSGHEIVFVPVDHPVETMGMIIRGPGGVFAFSGDTGPTQKLWDHCARQPDLRAVFLDMSFPDKLRDLASVSGHLTPGLLVEELAKIPAEIEIFLYHFKPVFFAELRREIKALHRARLHLVAEGDVFEF